MAKGADLDEQISSLMESIELEVEAKAAPPPRKAQPAAKEARRKRRPAARSAVGSQQPARTRVRAARAQPGHRTRSRRRGPLVADPAIRELAFFVLAGLMIGVAIGVLIALSS